MASSMQRVDVRRIPQALDHYMGVATLEFIAEWLQEENWEEHFREQVKASVPNDLQSMYS